MAYLHCPNLNLQNARYALLVYRELESRFPFSFKTFPKRVEPWIYPVRRFFSRLWSFFRNLFK